MATKISDNLNYRHLLSFYRVFQKIQEIVLVNLVHRSLTRTFFEMAKCQTELPAPSLSMWQVADNVLDKLAELHASLFLCSFSWRALHLYSSEAGNLLSVIQTKGIACTFASCWRLISRRCMDQHTSDHKRKPQWLQIPEINQKESALTSVVIERITFASLITHFLLPALFSSHQLCNQIGME
jgi:hypothetical protein